MSRSAEVAAQGHVEMNRDIVNSLIYNKNEPYKILIRKIFLAVLFAFVCKILVKSHGARL